MEIKSLIETLANMMNVNYLSDIRSCALYPQLYICIWSIDESMFSKEEWLDLYNYLTGKNIVADTTSEVYLLILNYLKKSG